LATSAALALSLVLDTADGHLARLQGTASPFGRWLDAVLDELGDMALHAAIAWAAFARDSAPVWLVLGMLYAMGKYLFQVVNATWEANKDSTTDEAKSSTGRTSIALESSLPKLVRLAGHADIRWHLWIVLAFLGRLDLGLAAYALYFPIRALGAAVRKEPDHA
jgi:phosphatidylglycerophosphate synthase